MGSLANQVRTKGDIQQIFKKYTIFFKLGGSQPP
jgi:hypothetical protein